MSRPELITSIASMREAVKQARRTGAIALVPTMGALHEGHLSLVRAARESCETVVVSIFVNPTQFGPNEDLARYPRTLDADLGMLEQESVQLVFAPHTGEMYPNGGAGTFVEVPGISERLDGASRPGHFRAVATVVAKLFHIVQPDLAFFGQKDAAQVAVLRAMVRDLNFPLDLVICPTVRERDGLAMSSRNRYLSPQDRTRSLVLFRALNAAQQQASRGTRCACELRRTISEHLQTEPMVSVEYVDVVNPDTLLPVNDVSQGALLAIAARIGETRLIDNILLAPRMQRTCAESSCE